MSVTSDRLFFIKAAAVMQIFPEIMRKKNSVEWMLVVILDSVSSKLAMDYSLCAEILHVALQSWSLSLDFLRDHKNVKVRQD